MIDKMARETLGNFELMVLLALMRVRDEAYGVSIAKTIEESTRKTVVLASVYAALERLEEKRIVSSRVGDPTAERGGRAKRYFEITSHGLRQVRETQRALTTLWRDLPQLAGHRA